MHCAAFAALHRRCAGRSVRRVLQHCSKPYSSRPTVLALSRPAGSHSHSAPHSQVPPRRPNEPGPFGVGASRRVPLGGRPRALASLWPPERLGWLDNIACISRHDPAAGLIHPSRSYQVRMPTWSCRFVRCAAPRRATTRGTPASEPVGGFSYTAEDEHRSRLPGCAVS